MGQGAVLVGACSVAAAFIVSAACSAGNNEGTSSATTSSSSSAGGQSSSSGGAPSGGMGGAGAQGGSTTDTGSGGDLSGVGVGGNGGGGGAMGCVEFSVEAQAKPAAMLITVDRSSSMTGTKWNAAQFAIINAIDKDVFDSMSLGLMAFPHSYEPPPECYCAAIGIPNDPATCLAVFQFATGNPGVSCGYSALPNIPIAFAGPDKSNAAMGVRREIYDYLVANPPWNNGDDGSPIYDALAGGYTALKGVSGVDERIQLLITDGGFSCASLTARGGYLDDANCPDWEYPDTVKTLIEDNFDDSTTPVRTFIIGVPGSDTSGEDVGPTCPNPPQCYATPPYSMKLALSTYAVAGSPDTIDPACDSATPFTQGGADPATPCHIDMTTGNFDANALADVIAGIRGNVLGCVYPVPDPPPGQTIDPTKVNVEVTIDGNPPVTIPARSNPADDCAVNACWDYDLLGNIEILGAGCDDISTANDVKVDVVVGCDTIIN